MMTGKWPFEVEEDLSGDQMLEKLQKGRYNLLPQWVDEKMKSFIDQMIKPNDRPKIQSIFAQALEISTSLIESRIERLKRGVY